MINFQGDSKCKKVDRTVVGASANCGLRSTGSSDEFNPCAQYGGASSNVWMPVECFSDDYNPAVAADCDEARMKDMQHWIEDILPEYKKGDLTYHEWLGSGQVLCELANKLKPGSCKTKTKGQKWTQAENIVAFLNFCRQEGVPEDFAFSSVQLLEGKKDVWRNVEQCMWNLGSVTQSRPEYADFYQSYAKYGKHQFKILAPTEKRNAALITDMNGPAILPGAKQNTFADMGYVR